MGSSEHQSCKKILKEKNTLGCTNLCALMPDKVFLRFKYLSEKLHLSQNLPNFRGSRFSYYQKSKLPKVSSAFNKDKKQEKNIGITETLIFRFVCHYSIIQHNALSVFIHFYMKFINFFFFFFGFFFELFLQINKSTNIN